MDRESYENEDIARIINENYIPVKVDRDERPDIDARYQTAVSALTGQGGWPLTAFLTPDGKPFYGGTYFPPDDYYGRPGMRRVLQSIAGTYNVSGNTNITGGTVQFNSPATANAALLAPNGTLAGDSTFTTNAIFNWTGGTMSGSSSGRPPRDASNSPAFDRDRDPRGDGTRRRL